MHGLRAGIAFIDEPDMRCAGKPGEQATPFFVNPSGNAIEIEALGDITKLFAK